jgi:hypothetical protein
MSEHQEMFEAAVSAAREVIESVMGESLNEDGTVNTDAFLAKLNEKVEVLKNAQASLEVLPGKCVECGSEHMLTYYLGEYKGVKRRGGTPLCADHYGVAMRTGMIR